MTKKEKPQPETSPARAAAEELEFLRKQFRETVDAYAAAVEAGIVALQTTVTNEAQAEKLSRAQLNDLRDMLTVLRKLGIKPEKGKRKDLKKIDLVVDDLRDMLEKW